MNKTLYLPIETKVREYQGKLLLAMHAAQADFQVVMGGHVTIADNLARMPRGLVVEHQVGSINLPLVERARLAGQRLAAWCEEGVNIFNHRQYAARRVDPRVMEEVELFFAWGSNQAVAVTKRAPHAKDRVLLSGNPRFDLLREPYRQFFAPHVEELRQEHGPYILINTSFSIYNHFLGPDHFLTKRLRKPADAATDYIAFYEGLFEHIKKAFFAFKKLIPELSKAFPQHKIIIRPHPSENKNAWIEAVSSLPNVKVIYEGPAVPWIYGADALLHKSCTTGVEGYILGRPVISYRPVIDDNYEHELTKAVSLHAFTPEEVVARLREAVAEPCANEVSEEAMEVVNRYISGRTGPLASELITQALRDFSSNIESGASPDSANLAKKLR